MFTVNAISDRSVRSERLAQVVREHEDMLIAVAMRLCKNRVDAEDLVQDTFERAFIHLHTVEANKLRGWLARTLYNLFVDGHRRRQRQRTDGRVSVETMIPAPDAEATPVWADISPRQLRQAVSRLSDEFRTVYELHALDGKSYIEISERLGIPKATVGTRLVRARKKLRELLTQACTQEVHR